MRRAAVRLATATVAAAAAACGFAAAHGTTKSRAETALVRVDVPVIVTAAPVYDSLAALRGGERFPRGAELMLLRSGGLTPLVPGLSESADASVSFDGVTVLFAGRRTPGEPWRIWQMALRGGPPRMVRAAQTDLIRPMWMPGGRMVYARRQATGFVLETAAVDGTHVPDAAAALQLNYVPGNFIPDDVLRDGRVLFESGFPLGAGTKPEIYAVYADGSGVEAVRCDHSEAEAQGGREHAREMPDGDVLFVQAGRLERFTPAAANEVAVRAPAGDYAGDATELPDGQWLLAVRRPGERNFELALWRPPVAARFRGDPEARAGAAELTTVASDEAQNLVEPVLVQARTVPLRHPSGLHPWTTANLMALDSRLSRSGELRIAPTRVRVETLNAKRQVALLGTAPVAKDGSFYVKVAADRPLRFVMLDAQGRILRQEHGWFWIRRGEQRICVGCHTGPERAPDNRVPQILEISTTPADATGAGGR